MLLCLFMFELFIIEKGLINYWGYNLVNFFVFELCYGVLDVFVELKFMVDVYYIVGFEVIVDVVFNYIVEVGNGGFIFFYKGFCFY